jgi:hypothetical protein
MLRLRWGSGAEPKQDLGPWERLQLPATPSPTSVSSRTWCSFVETRLIIFVLSWCINTESSLKMAVSGVNGWVGVFIVKYGKLDCLPPQHSWSVLPVCVAVVQSVKWRLQVGHRGTGILFSTGERYFSVLQKVYTDSGPETASYSKLQGWFPQGQNAGWWSWPFTL